LRCSQCINAAKLSTFHQSEINRDTIIIIDTIGQLKYLYGISKIVFIGKSLRVGGGQNMIEPLSFGKATIVGPLTQNFRDVVKIFMDAEALIVVKDEYQMYDETASLLRDSKRLNTFLNQYLRNSWRMETKGLYSKNI